jgi:hypothetical protein
MAVGTIASPSYMNAKNAGTIAGSEPEPALLPILPMVIERLKD